MTLGNAAAADLPLIDQRKIHRQMYAGDDVVDYAFIGTHPNSADNPLAP